jgi:hypothetical protein
VAGQGGVNFGCQLQRATFRTGGWLFHLASAFLFEGADFDRRRQRNPEWVAQVSKARPGPPIQGYPAITIVIKARNLPADLSHGRYEKSRYASSSFLSM